MKIYNKIAVCCVVLFSNICLLLANDTSEKDSIDKAFEILKDAKVEAARKEIEITVRSVDI